MILPRLLTHFLAHLFFFFFFFFFFTYQHYQSWG